MEKVYYNYLNYLYSVYLRYEELKEAFTSYPEGSLLTYTSKRDGTRYYSYSSGKRKYISPKNTSLINSYKSKQEAAVKLNEASEFLQAVITPKLKDIIRTSALHLKFPVSISEENYKREELKHRTAHGELVRSKSEVIIADLLFKIGVQYKYEKLLKTKEGNVFPDFTVTHPYTGKTYYIEHAGMLDDDDYVADFAVKLSKYKSIGITEKNYLIVTTEKSGNINAKEVQKLFENKFTFMRFLPLLEFCNA